MCIRFLLCKINPLQRVRRAQIKKNCRQQYARFHQPRQPHQIYVCIYVICMYATSSQVHRIITLSRDEKGFFFASKLCHSISFFFSSETMKLNRGFFAAHSFCANITTLANKKKRYDNKQCNVVRLSRSRMFSAK